MRVPGVLLVLTLHISCQFRQLYGWSIVRHRQRALQLRSQQQDYQQSSLVEQKEIRPKFNYILDEFPDPIDDDEVRTSLSVDSVACRSVASTNFRLSLLPSEDLEAAGHLVVDANYSPAKYDDENEKQFKQRTGRTGLLAAPFNAIIGSEIFSSLISRQHAREKESFTNKVIEGFSSRSYGRILKPTTKWSKDSAIIAAYDCRLPPGGEGLVGIVEVYPTTPPYLCNLAIAPRARRAGLARILCRTVENLVYYEWGGSSLTLQVERSNAPARRLYESLGYAATSASSGWLPSLNSVLLGEAHLVTYEKEVTGHPVLFEAAAALMQ